MKEKFYILLVLAFVLAACSESNMAIYGDKPIALSAAISETLSVSRAYHTEEIRDNVPSEEYPLNALVCFSCTDGVYSGTPVPVSPSYLPCNTKISYTTANKTYPDPYSDGTNRYDLKYPQDNSLVYCVGLHPNEDEAKWSFVGDSKVRYEVDGIHDAMYAPQISGQWETPFPNQVYTHMQSWMKIVVSAVSEDAVDAWGGIESVKINSGKYIDIDLSKKPDPAESSAYGKGIVFSDNIDMYVVTADDNIQLTTNLTEIAEFFYVPVGNCANQTITIKTKNRGEKTISFGLIDKDNNPIDTQFDAIGKLYVVELHFHPMEFIKANCILEEWEALDDNLYLE